MQPAEKPLRPFCYLQVVEELPGFVEAKKLSLKTLQSTVQKALQSSVVLLSFDGKANLA